MYGEKAWQQLHKNAASNIEQVLEATPHKTATLQPSTTIEMGGKRGSGRSVLAARHDDDDESDSVHKETYLKFIVLESKKELT